MAKKPSKSAHQKLAEKYFAAIDRGKAAYEEAGAALEQIIGDAKVGDELALSDGRTATLVDQFAEKNKVFKPCGVERFTLKLSYAAAV